MAFLKGLNNKEIDENKYKCCLSRSAIKPYLVPAFQWPFSLLQHEALVFIWPLDVALADSQSLNDFPAVCLLGMERKTEPCRNSSVHFSGSGGNSRENSNSTEPQWPGPQWFPQVHGVASQGGGRTSSILVHVSGTF